MSGRPFGDDRFGAGTGVDWGAMGGTGSWPRLVALGAELPQRGGVPRARPAAVLQPRSAAERNLDPERLDGADQSLPRAVLRPAGPVRLVDVSPPPPRGNRAVADGDRAGGVVPSPESRS